MTNPPHPSTYGANTRTWLSASNIINSQDAPDYFSPPESAMTSSEMPSLAPSSCDEHSFLPQVTSPNHYSSPPSPASFPPSPLVAATAQKCNMPLACFNPNAASSPPSGSAMPCSGPFPNPVLNSNSFDDLRLHSARLSLPAQLFRQSPVTDNSQAQSALLTMNGYNEPRFHVADHKLTVPSFPGQWPEDMLKHHSHHHQQQPQQTTTQNNMTMSAAQIQDVAHPHQYSLESGSLPHWHPYNCQHALVRPPSGSFQSYGSRQLSAPSSPIMSSSVSTEGSPTWRLIPQHRRTVSAGHPQADEFGRRFPDDDLAGHLVPGFPTSLPLNSPEMLSTALGTNISSSCTLSTHTPIDSASFATTGSTFAAPALSMPTTSASSIASGSSTPGVYKCEYDGCTKSFSRPYNLNSHIRTHTNLRPYQCDHCDRQFARLHDKNRHERLHRGVRPYACERCQHHFARMDALNRHLKVEGGRNLCNMYLIQNSSPNAMPLVDLPPKKINPLILAHFPDFGKISSEDDSSSGQP